MVRIPPRAQNRFLLLLRFATFSELATLYEPYTSHLDKKGEVASLRRYLRAGTCF